MEPNKFTTIIHSKANRIRRLLVYAILEWTLIFFLLLNSIFSYLILKFALYFGLKPPCVLCSRLDHIFNPHNSEPFYRSLICEQHSVELSKSGYCFIHRKLVESHDMCVDCSDSSSTDKQLTCCCCGASIRSENKPTHFVIEPTQKGNLVSGNGFSREFEMGNSDQGFLLNSDEAKEGSLVSNVAIAGAYENDVILPQHLEFYIDSDDYGLIPVELLNLDQEVGSKLWRETDKELVFEPDVAALPAAGLVDGKLNLDSFCLDFLKFDEPNAEDFPREQSEKKFDETKAGTLAIINGAVKELNEEVAATVKSEPNEEVDGTMKSDEAKIETLATTTGPQEELNEDVAAAKKSDEAKNETLANINGPEDDLNEEFAGTIVSDKAKIETLATFNVPEEDLNEEMGGAMISDEVKIETLAAINCPEEELNEEVAATVKSDEAKIETLVTISGPEELNEEVAVTVKSDEAKIETLATIKGPEEELKKEFAATVKSDELKNEILATINGPEEDLNEEMAGTMISNEAKIEDLMIKEDSDEEVKDDGSKFEIIPIIQGQAEETNREAAVDQEPCVSLTNSDDDHVAEINEVDFKLPRTDSGVLYHKESDGVGINNGKVALCGASNGTCALLENGHYDGSMKTNGIDEVEEERIPDTPTSIDSFQLVHNRMLLIGRSKTPNEGSLDDSVVNDNGYGNEEESIEELKSKLRAEQKAFNALYEELEEERNAAAISASQTMAMINRLQEEKAAIEMEALQYQRMMEEQSEYDHEALELMNDLLVKREKELEACMNKLMEYEEKHKSVEVDPIVNMKDSLSCFEEERISILEQLKVLEENLCALADEEEHQIRNLSSFEELYTNGEHHQMNGSKALVSDNEFFDEDGGFRLDPFLLDGLPLTQLGSEKRRFTIEEEVERLYERLNALEEDKEFIKNCLGSLRKGDRGIHLLQEILQHLRDLKTAEFRARKVC